MDLPSFLAAGFSGCVVGYTDVAELRGHSPRRPIGFSGCVVGYTDVATSAVATITVKQFQWLCGWLY